MFLRLVLDDALEFSGFLMWFRCFRQKRTERKKETERHTKTCACRATVLTCQCCAFVFGRVAWERILAEGAIALSVTLSGGVLFAS